MNVIRLNLATAHTFVFNSMEKETFIFPFKKNRNKIKIRNEQEHFHLKTQLLTQSLKKCANFEKKHLIMRKSILIRNKQ